MNEKKILQMRNITKSFYGNTVLDNVSFDLNYGEVLGLIGQNGAGKSTLMKILTGAYIKDSGKIIIENKEVSIQSILDANNAGISLVFQELSLASNMSVADNIFVGEWPKNKMDLINRDKLYEKAQELIDKFNIDINPWDIVGDLSIGKRQIVEILKAVSKNPKVLILDEPTSSLEESEIKILFNFIRSLKAKGFSIIYISHHMSEIFEIVDTMLVLRDGKKVLECSKDEISVKELIGVMIGKDYETYIGSESSRTLSDKIMYQVTDYGNGQHFNNINFSIAKGEILGIAGIVGCGKNELCETLFGVRKSFSGFTSIDGKRINKPEPAECRKQGLLCIPESRATQGLFLNDTIENNIIACVLDKVKKRVFVDNEKVENVIEKYKRLLNIKMTSNDQIIRFLSGGNQQKILVSKIIARQPKVLIAIDPTRGIDVASKADIHRILHKLSDEGLSVLVISSELDELITLCDRIIVMNNGQLTDEYNRKDFNETEILLSMHKSVEEIGA